MSAPETNVKCYNSFSCILSVLVIVFILGAIAWNLLVTTPAMRSSIDEIKTEVQVINQKLDARTIAPDSTAVIALPEDSVK